MAIEFKDRIKNALEYGFIRVSGRMVVRPGPAWRSGIAHICSTKAAERYRTSTTFTDPVKIGGWVKDGECTVCRTKIDKKLLKRCEFILRMSEWR